MAGIDTRAIDRSELPDEPFPSSGHEFRIQVSESAFDRITTRGASDTSREIGGVLVGRACRDAGGAYVRIDATIDALHAEEKGTELTFTHATWDHVHREMDAKHKDAKIVGWYHTHPGFGIFLSDRDQFIHRSFFNLPFQVALVFDPLSREHGVFAWRDNDPLRVRRWWVGDREHIWDGAHPPRGTAKPADQEDTPMAKDEQRPTAPQAPAPDVFTLGFAALVLLLLGAFGGWWVGQRGVADVVTAAQAGLDEARSRGMSEALRSLNVDLLGTLRRTVDQRLRSTEIEDAIAEIDTATKAITGTDEASIEQSARLGRARTKLRELRDAAPRVQATLQQLEDSIRAGPLNPAEVARVVQEHGRVLAQICVALAENAARNNDPSEARLLLSLAIRSDPGNADAYRKRFADPAGAPPK